MDLSKLPKMSDTRRAEGERLREQNAAPVPPADTDAGQSGAPASDRPPAVDYAGSRPVALEAGPSAWVSLIVGVVLLLFMPRWWQWLLHKTVGTAFTWTFTNADGSPLAYEDSVFFWGDLAVALFALALLVEGLALAFASGSKLAMGVVLGVVAAATALNLVYLVYMVATGYGVQLFSTLAVIFGVFMCVQQWQLLAGPRRRYLIVEG